MLSATMVNTRAAHKKSESFNVLGRDTSAERFSCWCLRKRCLSEKEIKKKDYEMIENPDELTIPITVKSIEKGTFMKMNVDDIECDESIVVNE